MGIARTIQSEALIISSSPPLISKSQIKIKKIQLFNHLSIIVGVNISVSYKKEESSIESNCVE